MDEDTVFRALADVHRRALLDRLFDRNGQTLAELSFGLAMTRQGVTKHLALLEEANLIATVRQGREKLHYLNPVPIGQIADRWINKFERGRVDGLIALKKDLERAMTDVKPAAVHMIHIAAPAQKIWDLLTDREISPSYFFGCRAEFGEVGEPFHLFRADGTLDSEGVVLVRDAPHHLRITWKVVWMEALKDQPPGEVDYLIEDLGNGVCRFTVSEFRGPHPVKGIDAAARQGWSMILSGIKTLAETGKPMPTQMPEVKS